MYLLLYFSTKNLKQLPVNITPDLSCKMEEKLKRIGINNPDKCLIIMAGLLVRVKFGVGK